jgi:hypothetical protein
MRTKEVTREFRDRCRELAQKCTMPEVRNRLQQLAMKYERELQKLEAPPIAPR